MERRDNKTEYVDLGLPSRTLWSTDYENLDSERLYLSYDKAENLKIPTKEQWEELYSICMWEYDIDNSYDYCRARCVGLNGQILTFERTDRKITSDREMVWEFFLLENANDGNEKQAVHLFNFGKSSKYKSGRYVLMDNFSGYQLPIRTVR